MQEPSLRGTVNTSRSIGLAPTHAEIRAQLKKILTSPAFNGAEILKSFLGFVGGKSLEGPEGEVKEYTNATEVFGRSDNYDPRIDSLVRVHAARLRSKLEEYYTSEGKSDHVYVSLPKGHYVPAFAYFEFDNHLLEPKEREEPKTAESHAIAPLSITAGRASSWWWLLPAGLCVISLLLGILAYRYYTEAIQLRQLAISQRVDPEFAKEISPFWGEFLSSESPVLVSYSNPLFRGNLVEGLKYLVPLQSSVARPRSPALSEIGPHNVIDFYTGVGEVKGVNFLGSLLWRAGSSFRVERSVLLTYEDLKDQHVIFLGGPSENLLLRRLPQEQDFVFKVEGTARGAPRVVIINRTPKPHEQLTYSAAVEGSSQSTVTEDYALISMLRGFEPNHRLLILAGITTFGTQACAEYVTKVDSVKQLIEQLNISHEPTKPKLPSFFQILLKVKINDSVPVQTSYITHHVLN